MKLQQARNSDGKRKKKRERERGTMGFLRHRLLGVVYVYRYMCGIGWFLSIQVQTTAVACRRIKPGIIASIMKFDDIVHFAAVRVNLTGSPLVSAKPHWDTVLLFLSFSLSLSFAFAIVIIKIKKIKPHGYTKRKCYIIITSNRYMYRKKVYVELGTRKA